MLSCDWFEVMQTFENLTWKFNINTSLLNLILIDGIIIHLSSCVYRWSQNHNYMLVFSNRQIEIFKNLYIKLKKLEEFYISFTFLKSRLEET